MIISPDKPKALISRRTFLGLTAATVSSMILSACSDTPTGNGQGGGNEAPAAPAANPEADLMTKLQGCPIIKSGDTAFSLAGGDGNADVSIYVVYANPANENEIWGNGGVKFTGNVMDAQAIQYPMNAFDVNGKEYSRQERFCRNN